jgi:copper homeostasis protein CutC
MSDTVQSKLVAFCEKYDDLNLFAPSASQLKSIDDIMKFGGMLKMVCAKDTERVKIIDNFLKSADYIYLKTHVAELEKENADLKTEIAELKARPVDAVKKVAPAPVDSKELEGLKKANKDLLAKNATLEADIATLKARPATTGKKAAAAPVDSEAMKKLKKENDDLLETVAKAMEEVDKKQKLVKKWYGRAITMQRKYSLLKSGANPKEKATKPTGKDKATPAKSAADVLVGGGKKEKPTKPTEAEKAAQKEAARIARNAARNAKNAENRQKKAEEAKKAQAAKLDQETSGEEGTTEPATKKRKIASGTPTPEVSDAEFSDGEFSDESDHATGS